MIRRRFGVFERKIADEPYLERVRGVKGRLWLGNVHKIALDKGALALEALALVVRLAALDLWCG